MRLPGIPARLFALLTPLLLLGGCTTELAGPVETFEQTWQDFDELYGGFEVRAIDWDEVYARHRPLVHEGMSDDELFTVATDMLSELDDGHVNVVAPGREMWNANAHRRGKVDFDLFDVELVREHYLAGDYETDEWESHTLGTLPDGSAYLHLPWVSDNLYVLERARELGEQAGRLVLDMRHSGGGTFTYATEALRDWTDESLPVWKTRSRNGPERDDFTGWWTWRLEGRGSHPDFDTVVLIDRYTISASERMTVILEQLPRVTFVGEPTSGALSCLIGREMLNGWTVTIASREVRNLDGTSYEGVGLPPDLEARNDPALMEQGIDTVLETGMAQFEP
ncbi:MAG: S41 family peptidase [Deltaproteobacteria bacterium]|nr:S41 family peptidase [Deltaproteobacteria bacterium]